MEKRIVAGAITFAVLAALAWYTMDWYRMDRESTFQRAWDIGYGAGKQAAVDSVEAGTYQGDGQ